MIRKIRKICLPVMGRRDMKGYFGIDFCMRIFILIQPALALPVFLNLMLTAYEAGRVKTMAWYGILWFVLGGVFLLGRYWFDIAVNGAFYNKTIENLRDMCLEEIYGKDRSVGSDYDANPYFAFLQDGVEEFTLLLFRIGRLAAILLVTAFFFLWCARIAFGMAVLAFAGGTVSVLAGNFVSKRLNRGNEELFRQRAEWNGVLRNLFYGTGTWLVKGKYSQVQEAFERKMGEFHVRSRRHAERAVMRANGLRMLDFGVYMVMILWCYFCLREKSAAVILTMISAYETMKRYGNELNGAWMWIAERGYLVERFEDIMEGFPLSEEKNVREEGGEQPVMSAGNVVEIRNLCYQAGGSEILRDINMEIARNEKVALVGSNGAGKSTLLRCILGLIQPAGGEIRRKNGLVFSYIPVNPQLFPVSIIENIRYASGCNISGNEIYETADITDVMEAADVLRIDSIGLGQELRDGDENLSGGEAQRVSLARAFAMPGELLIADEPTANLDIRTEKKVMEGLLKRSGALIYTTHNPALVAYADKVYIMKRGRIAACGTPEDVRGLPVYQEWARNVREEME